MKNIFFLIITSIFSSAYVVGMDKEPEIQGPHSVAWLAQGKLAVAGKNGCIIFDRESRKPLHVVDREDIFDMAANKDRTILVLSKEHKDQLFYDVEENIKATFEIPKNYPNGLYSIFSCTQNKIFYHKSFTLTSYDFIQDEHKTYEVPFEHASRQLSCHPTKNEILFSRFYSKNSDLSVLQPDCIPFIKTKFLLDFGSEVVKYAPDGHSVIMSEQIYKQYNYFICDLNDSQNPLPAHQLIADNKDYIANTFHQKNSIIALLTKDSSVHFFDYAKRTIVAKTKKLVNNECLFGQDSHKRLDIDEIGKYLAIALKDRWTILDVPQNNFYEIWKTLRCKDLPKEVAAFIMAKIVALYHCTYEFLDLKQLCNITLIKQPMPEANTYVDETPMALETETKQIKAVYVRPVKNPEIYDYRGIEYWRGD